MWRLHVSSEAELEIFEAALRYEREREGRHPDRWKRRRGDID
jgi:hypothetical protein